MTVVAKKTDQPTGTQPVSRWDRAHRLWRDFTGESAYDTYLARHTRHHPDHPPLTKREFWRQRADFDEQNVQTGCC